MKFKGQPGEAVFMMARTHRKGKPVRKYLFSFDQNGEYVVDEATVSENVIERLKAKFEIVEVVEDIEKMKRKELFALAKKLGVEVKPPISNKEIREAIKEVM